VTCLIESKNVWNIECTEVIGECIAEGDQKSVFEGYNQDCGGGREQIAIRCLASRGRPTFGLLNAQSPHGTHHTAEPAWSVETLEWAPVLKSTFYIISFRSGDCGVV